MNFLMTKNNTNHGVKKIGLGIVFLVILTGGVAFYFYDQLFSAVVPDNLGNYGTKD